MDFYQVSSDDYNKTIHCILFGADAPGADSPPAYSDEEEVILEAIRTVFGQVRMTWMRLLEKCPEYTGVAVCLEGTGRGSECHSGTRARALCNAATRLATRRAPRQTRTDVAPGFYWFRPTPYQPVYPIDVSIDGGCHTTYEPFFFTVAEPMPVFVHEVDGCLLVTGMASPMDWPMTAHIGDSSEIALEDLPGELGPRLDAPAAWGTDHQPERLIVNPVRMVRVKEPKFGHVDVWTGDKVEVGSVAASVGADGTG